MPTYCLASSELQLRHSTISLAAEQAIVFALTSLYSCLTVPPRTKRAPLGGRKAEIPQGTTH